MKSAWKRSVAGFFLWSALAGLAAAQGADDGREWDAWKGTQAPWKNVAEAERTVADYRAWLAELRVKLMTGRTAELPGWEERLELIRLHATSAVELPAQRELLVEVTRARAQALATQGHFAEARAAAEAVLFARGDPSAAGLPLKSAPPHLLALAKAALADPALEEVRTELSPTAPAAAVQDEGLDERLRQALAEGDLKLVAQIGARAAPVLEQTIAADLQRLPPEDIRRDPFFLFTGVAERRAAAFALAHIDSGYAFRLRVAGALAYRETFKSGGPTPEWSLVLAGLLRHADSAGNALPFVRDVIEADQLSPELTASLVAALQGPGGRDLTSELMKRLEMVSDKKGSALGLSEFLVGNEDPLVRRSAAARLFNLDAVPALVQRAEDPDLDVRRLVARSLSFENSGTNIPLDERTEGALHKLLADSSWEVRRQAATALVEWPVALEPELYRTLARDPHPRVRSRLAWINHPEEGLVRDVLESLARDADPEVRSEVDKRLQDPQIWKRPQAILPAAEVRLLEPTWPSEERSELIRRMAPLEEGVRVLFASAAKQPSSTLLAEILTVLMQTGVRMHGLLALDDESLALSYVLVQRASQNTFFLNELNTEIEQAETPRWAAMQRVLEDPAAPVEARLFAAKSAAPGGGERFRAALLALFAAEPLRSRQLAEDESQLLDEILGAMPDEDRNPLALSALQNEALNDRVRATVAGSYETDGPLAREITLAILKRWLDAPDDRAASAVGSALYHLRSLPEDLDAGLLQRAARKPWYGEAAVRTMSALQDPVYLPALEAALGSTQDYDVLSSAVEGLTSFPGDQPTEILLRGAATGSPSVRTLCLNALGTRRQIEEQRRIWVDSKEARLDRADAVQKLLVQLRDADAAIRGQAARALATLGALETLPALIELLKDADPGVRKAAGEALERLNALPARDG